jgi:undecaprenyl-diphosphatase
MARLLTQQRGKCILLWLGAAVVPAALLLAATRVPILPGDVAVARWIQAAAPSDPTWARWVTATAKAPWVLALGGVAAILSFLMAGWRAGLLAVACFAGVRFGEPILKAWIGRPRPTPALILVLEKATGSSLPSGLVLIFAATFGLLLVLALSARGRLGSLRWLVATASGVMLILGGAARVALGAHWPSDVLLSYLLGGLWVSLLVGLLRSWRPGLR